MEKAKKDILKRVARNKQPKAYGGEFYPWYTRLFRVGKPDYPISGNCESKYASVEAEFRDNFLKGKEVGASVSIFSYEKCVAELYGGYSNLKKKIAFSESTLQLVFSCSKVMESLCLACFVDKGLLKYEDEVSSFWPEFGTKGKKHVTVADLMRHEGGVPYFINPQPSFADLRDPEKRRGLIANQDRIFDEGTRAYHAVTRGWIVNEVVKIVDLNQRTLGQIYKQEVNEPLNIEFYLGLEPKLYSRRSKWYNYPLSDTIMGFTFPNYPKSKYILSDFNTAIINKGAPFAEVINLKKKTKDFENSQDIVIDEIPSVNGFTNSKTLATVGALLANKGQLNGYQLISPSGLEQALGDPKTAFDYSLLLDTTMTRAGFGVFKFPEIPVDTQFYGWSGLGGSLLLFNPEYHFSFCYIMNGSTFITLVGGKAKSLFITAFKARLASEDLI